MADHFSIRFATAEEGPLIQQVIMQSGGPDWGWADWSSVYPYWLIGSVNRHACGVINMAYSLPFARLELLYLDTTLTHRQRGWLAIQLCYAGIAACKARGASAVFSAISQTTPSWGRIAEHRGWAPTDHGTIYLKKVV